MSYLEPTELVADDSSGELVIAWSDGHETRHGFERLRWLCPCAECKGEWGQPGRLASTRSLTPEQTRLENMVPVGRYALQPIWGDGHNSGLFTYDYLRQTCECSECKAKRGEAVKAEADPA